MKLNNKGFTLIEVLMVIVILGIIGGIAVKSVLSTINNSRDLSYQLLEENIKIAAKALYEEVDNNNILQNKTVLYQYDLSGKTDNKIIINEDTINTNVQTLVSNGFLIGSNNNCTTGCKNENKKIVLNPKTKVDIGLCTITITKNVDNNYHVNYSFSLDKNCINKNEITDIGNDVYEEYLSYTGEFNGCITYQIYSSYDSHFKEGEGYFTLNDPITIEQTDNQESFDETNDDEISNEYSCYKYDDNDSNKCMEMIVIKNGNEGRVKDSSCPSSNYRAVNANIMSIREIIQNSDDSEQSEYENHSESIEEESDNND